MCVCVKVNQKQGWGSISVEVLSTVVSFIEAIASVYEAGIKCGLRFAREVPHRSCIFVLMKGMYEGVQGEPQGSWGGRFFLRTPMQIANLCLNGPLKRHCEMNPSYTFGCMYKTKHTIKQSKQIRSKQSNGCLHPNFFFW